MIYYNKEDKKNIHLFLNQHVDKIIDFLNYPQHFWDVSIPNNLKEMLKEFQEKYENINEQNEDFLINRLRSFLTNSEELFYLEKETFWKKYPYLDLLADYIQAINETESRQSQPDDDLYRVIFKDIHERIKSRLQSYQLGSLREAEEINYFNYQSMKPGKFIKKLFPDATAQDCEKFHQAWIQHFRKWDWKALELTDKVIKYYHHEQYADSDRGPLGNSCMRYLSTLRFMNFYEVNNVKMVIFRDPEDEEKIRARALVWENVFLPDNPNKKENNLPDSLTFVDRIYFNSEQDKLLVETWAEKMGYYRKKEHSPGWTGMIKPDGTVVSDLIEMNYPITKTSYPFPYIDTFAYLHELGNGELIVSTNERIPNSRNFITLRSTDGHYEGRMSRFSENIKNNFKQTYLQTEDRYIPFEAARVCENCYTVTDKVMCPVCDE